MEKYLNTIKGLLAEHSGVDPEEVTMESFFEDDLNVGEFELAEMLSELEEMYHIEIDDEEKEAVMTVEDLVNTLTDKVE